MEGDCTMYQQYYPDAKPLSSGTHGTIFIATDPETGGKVILKRLEKSGDCERHFKEIEVGVKLRGVQHVAFFHRFFETEEHMWLVFDHAEGVDLLTWMEEYDFEPVPDVTVRQIAGQLITTLSNVHEKGVAHKDIKLENLILDPNSGIVTLIDFGLAYSFRKGRQHLCQDFAGSREYAAPEIILTYGPFSAVKADIWSLGVTLYALLFGCFPFGFDAKTAETMISTGRHPEVTFPESEVSEEAIDLLSKMLQVDPDQRIDMESINAHPWFDF